MNNKLNFLLILAVILGIGLACGNSENTNIKADTVAKSPQSVEKIESYTLRGIKFSYYKIPAGLERDALIKMAKHIHAEESDANLILVDDTAQITEYIAYAKAFSQNDFAAQMPREWADKHIIANVQKLVSGKWQLYEGYGYREIIELE